MKPIIVMVDDDPLMTELVRMMVEPNGFEFHVATTAFRAGGVLARHAPDLVILDRQLPDGDGISLLKRLREDGYEGVPVLILSGRATARDKAAGLDQGADDYLAKPFKEVELLARIKALIRRRARGEEPAERAELDGLLLDVPARVVTLCGRILKLPAREFDLLAAFLERPGRVLDRRFLLERVWGEGSSLHLGTKAVDVAVARLRKVLGDWGRRLATVEDAGYRLDA